MFSRAIVISLAVLVFAMSSPAQGLPGAIWTTNLSGNQVDGNLYDLKADVYLNGGPLNCNGSGLPDGVYYFQVTTPDGYLLSADLVTDRQVTISGGQFVAASSHPFVPGTCGLKVQLVPFSDTTNAGHEYKVWITLASDYATNGGFSPSRSKTDNFKVRDDGSSGPQSAGITGYKFYDANLNGIRDAGEAPIAGWRIDLGDGGGALSTTYTGTNGEYSFLVPPNTGPYTVAEGLPNSMWIPITATSCPLANAGFGASPPNPQCLAFGNVCLGAGNGKTLGFWSNTNGQTAFGQIQPPALPALIALNLRNADGSNFDPASYAVFRTWLLAATATNMAYMLSAQMAAMDLNVWAGFVPSGALIYAPGTTSANPAGFASVGAVVNEANAELGSHGYTLAGSPYRSYQEALKNALDKANNNLNFLQPGPCPFSSPY